MNKKCLKTLSGKHYFGRHYVTHPGSDPRIEGEYCNFCGIYKDITVGKKTRKNKRT